MTFKFNKNAYYYLVRVITDDLKLIANYEVLFHRITGKDDRDFSSKEDLLDLIKSFQEEYPKDEIMLVKEIDYLAWQK